MASQGKFYVSSGISERELSVERVSGSVWRVELGEAAWEVDAVENGRGSWSLLIDGKSHGVTLEFGERGAVTASVNGRSVSFKLHDPQSRQRARMTRAGRITNAGGAGELRAPMPGKVVKVLVEAGQVVEAGQGLVVVEAMKMENELKAASAGRVVKILVSAGETVEGQQRLLTLSE